jgi:WD40 repeat protein
MFYVRFSPTHSHAQQNTILIFFYISWVFLIRITGAALRRRLVVDGTIERKEARALMTVVNDVHIELNRALKLTLIEMDAHIESLPEIVAAAARQSAQHAAQAMMDAASGRAGAQGPSTQRGPLHPDQPGPQFDSGHGAAANSAAFESLALAPAVPAVPGGVAPAASAAETGPNRAPSNARLVTTQSSSSLTSVSASATSLVSRGGGGARQPASTAGGGGGVPATLQSRRAAGQAAPLRRQATVDIAAAGGSSRDLLSKGAVGSGALAALSGAGSVADLRRTDSAVSLAGPGAVAIPMRQGSMARDRDGTAGGAVAADHGAAVDAAALSSARSRPAVMTRAGTEFDIMLVVEAEDEPDPLAADGDGDEAGAVAGGAGGDGAVTSGPRSSANSVGDAVGDGLRRSPRSESTAPLDPTLSPQMQRRAIRTPSEDGAPADGQSPKMLSLGDTGIDMRRSTSQMNFAGLDSAAARARATGWIPGDTTAGDPGAVAADAAGGGSAAPSAYAASTPGGAAGSPTASGASPASPASPAAAATAAAAVADSYLDPSGIFVEWAKLKANRDLYRQETRRIYAFVDTAVAHYLLSSLTAMLTMSIAEVSGDRAAYGRCAEGLQHLASDFVRSCLPIVERSLAFEPELFKFNLFHKSTRGLAGPGAAVTRAGFVPVVHKVRLLDLVFNAIDVFLFPPVVLCHEEGIKDIAFSALDPSYFLTASYDRTLRIHCSKSKFQHAQFAGHRSIVTACRLARDDTFAISGSADGTLRRWDTRTGACDVVFRGHQDSVTDCDLGAGDTLLCSSSMDRTVRIWDAETGQCTRLHKGHTAWVKCVRFVRNATACVSAGLDGKVFLWNLGEAGTEAPGGGGAGGGGAGGTGGGGAGAGAGAGAAGEAAAATTDANAAAATDANAAREFRAHSDYICSIAVHGELLVTCSRDCSVRLWSWATGKAIKAAENLPGQPSCLSFSDDGRYIAASSFDNHIFVFRAEDLRLLRHLKVQNQGILTSRFGLGTCLTIYAGTANGYVQELEL